MYYGPVLLKLNILVYSTQAKVELEQLCVSAALLCKCIPELLERPQTRVSSEKSEGVSAASWGPQNSKSNGTYDIFLLHKAVRPFPPNLRLILIYLCISH